MNLLTVSAGASALEDIEAFLEEVAVKTYDCPASELMPQLENYLLNPNLSPAHGFELKAHKAHWQICQGKASDAKNLLDDMLADPAFDRSSYAYALAIYEVGFIYDLLENDRRCEYYQQAESLSKDKFDDIYLSAQLGQITVCNKHEGNDGIKLGRMYALLESYSAKGDEGTIAHIHHNIGLLYGSLGQHVLAAEQYQKAYEMGLSVYTGSNLVAALHSVITSQFASGDFEGARVSIDELKRISAQVNTPLSNMWVHLTEAGFYYRTDDIENLRDSLAKWAVYLPEIGNATYHGFHRWYSAKVCLFDKDEACLRQFLAEEEQANKGYKAAVSGNKDYLKLQVEIQLALGDLEQAKEKYQVFSEFMLRKAMREQASGKVLGVANLHNQVLNLEASLEEAERQRMLSIGSLVVAFVLTFVLVFWALKRKYLEKLANDPLTGLHNTRSVIDKIKRVDRPRDGLTNAIALFDLDNFKEMNSQFGHLAGDKALQQVASTLKNVTRDKDIIGRLASEQFLVCLTNIEEGTATRFFERIRNALENTILSADTGDKVNIHSSMSIYVSTEPFSDLDDVLADMQIALQRNNHKRETEKSSAGE